MEPVLTREVVIGAIEQILLNSTRYPLFDLFPREQYDGRKLIIYGKRRVAQVGQFTTADGPMHEIDRGTLSELEVEPLFHRPSRSLDSSEMALFSAWNELRVSQGAASQAIEAKAQQKVAEIAGELLADSAETLHDMLAQALQGTGSYTVDGVAVAVNYGLTALTAPGVLWSNAAAPIIQDIWAAKAEFADNCGTDPDTVFYNPAVWSTYLVQNTEFSNYVKAVPELSKAFAGYPSAPQLAGPNGAFVDALFGMLWVPITGQHRNLAGTAVARWPVDVISMAALRAEDNMRVLEHAMVRDQYTPRPEPNVETWATDDPKTTFIRRADNGAAVIKDQSRIQTWTVA